MNREIAKEAAKRRLEEYLERKGINTKKPFRCLNPSHEDRNPSMSFDRRRDRAHCFSCGVDYDIFDIVGIDYGIVEDRYKFEKAYEVLGISVDGYAADRVGECSHNHTPAAPQSSPFADYSRDFQCWRDAYPNSPAAEYMATRKIFAEIAEQFGLGFCAEWRHPKFNKDYPASPRVIIPNGLSHYTARDIRPKDKMTELELSKAKMKVGVAAPVFNASAIKNAAKPIFIVEGEIDALSLIAMGAEAIALGSASNVQKLIDLLRHENATEAPASISPFIIAMDNDPAAAAAVAKIKAEFDTMGIFYTHPDPAVLYGGEKDANDALVKLEEWRFTANIQEAEREAELLRDAAAAAELAAHRQTSAAHHIDELIDVINSNADTPPTSTGFKELDNALDGGLYEGLYVLGAISSLGKTTMVMQIADQIARAGRDVLIFSLEMARTELIAKSISRHTLTILNDKSRALTTRGITDGRRYQHYTEERRRLIKDAIEEYRKTAENVYIHEGVGDMTAERIREILELHVRITNAQSAGAASCRPLQRTNTPVVVVDYLQIITPHSDRATDKQATDKAVLELKRMSRDFKIPVIAISSFNRDNYNTSVNMSAFKESGAVEYSADVLMGLQLEGMDELGRLDPSDKQAKIDELKTRDPRRVELKILKHRNGPTGAKISFDFYAPFNCFRCPE